MLLPTLLYLLLPITLTITLTTAMNLPGDALPRTPPPTMLIPSTGRWGGNCQAVYGDHLLLPDCDAALNQMRNHLDAAQRAAMFVGPFSRNNVNALYSLPKVWRTPTCSIALDVKNAQLSAQVNWDTRVAVAAEIVRECARGRGVGGEWHSEEFFLTVVVNERRIATELRPTWARCLAGAGGGAGGRAGLPGDGGVGGKHCSSACWFVDGYC